MALNRPQTPSGRVPPTSARPSGQDPKRSFLPPGRSWLPFLLILALNYFVVRAFFVDPDAPITVPYTAFKAEVIKKNVEAIYARGESLEGRFTKPVSWPPPNDKSEPREKPRESKDFETTLPVFVDPGLEALLIDNGVEIRAVPIQAGGFFRMLLMGFGPTILIFA